MLGHAPGRVGVVVVTYHSARHIPGLLGLFRSESVHQVVVVDNASGDGTVEELNRAGSGHPELVVLQQDRNLGFGVGCNIGEEALEPRCEYALFLNPDARIAEPDLRELVRYLDGHPRCAVAAPRLFREGVALCSSGRRATLLGELRFVLPRFLNRYLADRRDPPEPPRNGPVDMVEGACMLVRRSAFRSVGRFDPRYFLFFEEHDLARRLAQSGWTVDLCSASRAEHLVGDSRSHVAHAALPQYFVSAALYLRIWQGPAAALVYRFLAVWSWRFQKARGRLNPAVAAANITAVRRR